MPAAHDIKKLSGYDYSYFVSQRKFSFCCFQLFVPLAALCVPFGFVLRAFRWEFRIPHRARTTKSRVNVVPWQGAKKSPQAYKNGLREDQAALPRVLPTGKQSSRRLKPRQWPELGKGTYVVVVQVRLLD